MAGQPRVYALALQVVAHGDGRLSRSALSRFVAAYQSVQPLQLGELWAIPIMLRLGLIENLRRVAARVAAGRTDRERAARWADLMLDAAEKAPSQLILLIADMARESPPLSSSFVAEFARRLQGRGAALVLPLTWLEQRLGETGVTIEQRVNDESKRQAANQVSVSNSIASLRLIGAMDWRDFVETLSAVEQTLRSDPAGIYAQMDFGTRDRYRHAVERIARLAGLPEIDVAQRAVAMAAAAAQAANEAAAIARTGNDTAGTPPNTHDPRRGHVGHYLIGAGRAALQAAVQAHVSRTTALRDRARRSPLVVYGGAIALATLVLVAGPLFEVRRTLGWPWWQLLPLALLLVLGTSQFAVALVNWAATLLVQPSTLPRMDYSFGIASQARTLVVVPTMLTHARGIDELAEALEVRFLANRDPHLHFGLLTDFLDAPAERLPGRLVPTRGCRMP